EKLHEDQISQAIAEARSRGMVNTSFFVALADEARAEYRLYLESDGPPGLGAAELAADLDRRLAELNIEYAEKRASGRLGALRAAYLAPGTGDAYMRDLLAAGQRDAQLKVLPLQYLRDCSFDFDSQCMAAAEA
ncbi:MAG: GH3 auxin-responsive promoter family protein, partial [Alphaproteobacteria bacterium]|nr:GH3 auxin-responsive promoter family protein [Alphaproteobacteria bacterium]